MGRTVEHGSGEGPSHDTSDQRHSEPGDEKEAHGHRQQHEGRTRNPRALEKAPGQDGNTAEGLALPSTFMDDGIRHAGGGLSGEEHFGRTFGDLLRETGDMLWLVTRRLNTKDNWQL